MADPRPQDTLNPEEVHAGQPEEATGDPGNSATDTATDAEVTEVPETLENLSSQKRATTAICTYRT